MPREVLLNTFTAQVLHLALRRELRKSELLAAADKLGLSSENVKMLVEMLHAKGVTTRYNDAGGLDSPPFIILDEEGAKREMEEAVRRAERLLISP